jgi:hypothetical protein
MITTTRQKRLAKNIVDSLQNNGEDTAKAIVEKSGYTGATLKNPKQVISRAGVQEELQVLGFTEEAAKGVVASILHHSDNDMARLKASDQIFKVLGSYAPVKNENTNVNLNVEITPQEEEIAKKANEDLKKLYGEKET